MLSSEDLQESGAKRLWDLNGAIPGLYMSSYPSNMQYVNIRGIGTSDPGVFAAVGYYLDDVYLGRTFGRGSISLPDIERVEVLRGPQGTLYGQNTTGGAIKFVSRDPSLAQADNWASGSLGNFGQAELQAYLSAPLADTVSASLAYSHRENDGDHYNAYRGVDVNRVSVDQVRAKLRWQPVDDLNVVLALDGARDESDNYVSTPQNVPGGGTPRVIYANTDTRMNREDFGQTLRVDYTLNDELILRSITAHRRDHNDPHPWDQDAGPLDLFGWTQPSLRKSHRRRCSFRGAIPVCRSRRARTTTTRLSTSIGCNGSTWRTRISKRTCSTRAGRSMHRATTGSPMRSDSRSACATTRRNSGSRRSPGAAMRIASASRSTMPSPGSSSPTRRSRQRSVSTTS